ncbi:MAG: protein kinase domain-containing protein [Deltaproteobacteria bacterium]
MYSEFINGGNLRKWIIKSRIKDEKKKLLIILSIALQISYAMSNSHKQNVFHLDLRLENILDYKEKVNNKDPHIAIIDFGIHIKDKEELLKIIKSDCFLNYRKNPYYYRKCLKIVIIIK